MVYGHSGCLKLLHRLGFEYKRPDNLPARADEAGQAAFIEAHDELLNGLDDDEAAYFADAVHPQYRSRPAHGRVKKGDKAALRRTSGRRRINLHGALNLENFHCPGPGRTGRRTFHHRAVLDNARYHHARPVRQWLERAGRRIELVFLPACAPHLNAIER